MPPIIRVLRLSRYAKRVRVDGCACPSTARGRREPGGTWCATNGCVRTTRMSHHLPSYGRPAVMAGQRAVRPGISRDRPWYEAPPNEQARDGRRRIDPPLEPGRFTRRQGGEIGETRTDSARVRRRRYRRKPVTGPDRIRTRSSSASSRCVLSSMSPFETRRDRPFLTATDEGRGGVQSASGCRAPPPPRTSAAWFPQAPAAGAEREPAPHGEPAVSPWHAHPRTPSPPGLPFQGSDPPDDEIVQTTAIRSPSGRDVWPCLILRNGAT